MKHAFYVLFSAAACVCSANVTQAAFSRMIGVSVDTLQNWEQGRREPEGPARALLTVAAKNPQAVLSALHA